MAGQQLDVDKDELYGRYQDSEDKRQKLHRKVVHKALDIPMEEDVNVDNRRNYSGLGWKELAVIGAVGLGSAGLFKLANTPDKVPAATSPAPVGQSADAKASASADLRFYKRLPDGTVVPIDLPRLPEELRK